MSRGMEEGEPEISPILCAKFVRGDKKKTEFFVYGSETENKDAAVAYAWKNGMRLVWSETQGVTTFHRKPKVDAAKSGASLGVREP